MQQYRDIHCSLSSFYEDDKTAEQDRLKEEIESLKAELVGKSKQDPYEAQMRLLEVLSIVPLFLTSWESNKNIEAKSKLLLNHLFPTHKKRIIQLFIVSLPKVPEFCVLLLGGGFAINTHAIEPHIGLSVFNFVDAKIGYAVAFRENPVFEGFTLRLAINSFDKWNI